MTEQHEARYSVWFNRVGRGIALIGPTLLLLVILATFVTRLGVSPERSTGPEAPETPAPPSTDDRPTTAAPESPIFRY